MKIVREVDDLPRHLIGTEFAFDTETTGLNYGTFKVVGISLANSSDSYYIPVIDIEGAIPINELRPFLQELFSKPSTAIAHNMKFDIKALTKLGVEVLCDIEDTIIASWLLDERKDKHRLKDLAVAKLGLDAPEIEFNNNGALDYAMNRVGAKEGQLGLPCLGDLGYNRILAKYAAADALNTYLLWFGYFKPNLDRFQTLYQYLDKPLIRVLAKMEMRGAYIDVPLLTQYAEEVEHVAIPKIKDKIYHLAGTEFNIDSVVELGHLLFDVLKLISVKQTSKGKRSVDKEVLEELQHPLAEAVLEYRDLKKLLSTYLLPLITNSVAGRIYGSLNQIGTVTGRLSSDSPNLQNISAHRTVYNIRKAFIAPPGYKLIIADYSALELRVLAHFLIEYLNSDGALVQAFKQGYDAHKYMASHLYNMPMSKISDTLRKRTKSITFGICYGMGPEKLHKEIGVSYQEARDLLNKYYDTFSDIKDLQDLCVHWAMQRGVVQTLLGHQRRFRGDDKESPQTQAMNALIQGSAADIVKLAQLKIDKLLPDGAYQIIQVHDEIYLEVEDGLEEEVASIVKTCMDTAYPLHISLVATPIICSNWSEAK